MRVVGPLMWEPPGEPVDPPAGSRPVVLVAPSTAHDAEHALLRAALDGLAGEPVRVIATFNGRRPPWLDGYRVPANALLVPWLSYAGTMPHCDLVVTHGGHGTLVRALTSGCALVVSPVAGDMFENAERCAALGLGRVVGPDDRTPAAIGAAAREVLRDPRYRQNARRLRDEMEALPGPERGVELLERLAAERAPLVAEG